MKRTKALRNSAGQLAIRQGVVNAYEITYDPDTRRWHVGKPDNDSIWISLANFAERRNALAWAKKN